MIDPLLLLLIAFAFFGGAPKARRRKVPSGIPPSKQPPTPGPPKAPPVVPVPSTPDYAKTVTVSTRSTKGVQAEDVPPQYRPLAHSGARWRPYISGWSVATAKKLLRQRDVMPGQSLHLKEPGTNYLVKFRGETGKQHGNPNIVRAVTAWRKVQTA